MVKPAVIGYTLAIAYFSALFFLIFWGYSWAPG